MSAELNISWDGKPVPLSRIAEQLCADGFSVRKVNKLLYTVTAPSDFRGIPAKAWFEIWEEPKSVCINRIDTNDLTIEILSHHEDEASIPCGPVTMLLKVLAAMRGESIDESVDEDRLVDEDRPAGD